MYIQYIFDMILWSWIFFPRSKGLAVVRHPMVMFHVEGRAQSVFFGRDTCAICHICVRSVLFVRDLCAIRIICVRSVLFVHDLFCAWSVRDSCIILRSSCARCFHWSRVQTPVFPAWSFCRSRVWFLGPIAWVRPVKSLASVNDWPSHHLVQDCRIANIAP